MFFWVGLGLFCVAVPIFDCYLGLFDNYISNEASQVPLRGVLMDQRKIQNYAISRKSLESII